MKLFGNMNNIKIKPRLISFMLIIIAVPMLTLNMVFSGIYTTFYNMRIEESCRYITRESYDNIDYKLRFYSNMIDSIAYSTKLRSVLQSDYVNNMNSTDMLVANDLNDDLQHYIFQDNTEELYQLLIYPLNPNSRIMGQYFSNIGYIDTEEWFDRSLAKTQNVMFGTIPSMDVLSITQIIYSNAEDGAQLHPVGLIKLDIKLKSLFGNGIGADGKTFGVSMTDADGNVRYVLNDGIVNAKRQYCFDEYISSFGIGLKYSFDRSRDAATRLLFTGLFLLLALFLTAVLTMFIIIFSKGISSRVEKINEKMTSVQNGQFIQHEVLDGNDEFSEIDRGMNEMAARLKTTIEQNYINETEKKKAELKALQMQLNPHFMYNTLETINALAALSGSDDICTICQKMGEILRYNINSTDGEFVRLRQEMDNIRSYLDIQKIRFGSKLDVFYDVPEEMLDMRVLKFIIQPLVENAIKYGMRGSDDTLLIVITAKASGGRMSISIQDDGAGVESERKLSLIRERISGEAQSTECESIGLRNVNERIRITYGEGNGVKIESRHMVGTTVTLEFPAEPYTKGEKSGE